MFSARRTIFAGKQNLQPEPFCPYLSNSSGYLSLSRNGFGTASNRSKSHNRPRPSLRGGK